MTTHALRWAFSLLLTLACANAGWCGPIVKPDRVCRTLDELVDWEQSDFASQVEFDLDAHLILAIPTWTIVRVQDQGRAIALKVSSELASELSEIRAGTRLSFRGTASRETNGVARIHLLGYSNTLANELLSPKPARLAPGTRGTPLQKYAFENATIREIYRSWDRTCVIASKGKYDFEVMQYGKQHRLRPKNVDQRWYFSGVVRKGTSESLVSPLHEMILMNGEQMCPVEKVAANRSIPEPTGTSDESAPGEMTLEQFEGMVVFSDYTRNLGLVRGDQRFWLRTRMAHRIRPGIRLKGVGQSLWNHGLDVPCFRARFTEVIANHQVDNSNLAISESIEALSQTTPLPQRVRLKGTVAYCNFHDSQIELHLKTTRLPAVVETPVSQQSRTPSFGMLAEGTEIEFVGMPVRHWQAREGDYKIRICVASADDIRVISRPLTLPANRLFASGVVLVLGLICGGFWIFRLRRRVQAGDRSLTEFDHHFQTAFGAMQCGVLIVDDQSRILRSNHRLSAFFGVEPSLNTKMEQYLPSIDQEISPPSSMSDLIEASNRSPERGLSAEFSMRDLRRTTRVFTCPIELNRRLGQSRLWLFEDISEKRQLESELLQSQKMDAVGRLSGGIAHDFNNLLMVIQSSLGMIREEAYAEDRVKGDVGLRSAELAVKRASQLTQQLLGFARLQRMEKRRVNAVSLLDDVQTLASRVIGPNQKLIVEQQCDQIMVNVDPGRIEQALFNLCLNAIDAADEEGGEITLSISSTMNPTYGLSARFAVTDNGPGIDRDVQKNIFDPFFTTKPAGKGTGLGLSVALGIIEQHDGRIDCQSTPNRGTRFDVILPAITEEISKDPTPATAPTIEQVLSPRAMQDQILLDPSYDTSTLSVLVIEDEPDVCVASCSMLRQLGHQVDSVDNAIKGIQHIATQIPDLVLLDLMLPEMSGLEAFHEIRSAWPDLRILFCSGRGDAETLIREACGPDAPPLLAKPFKIDQLKLLLTMVIESSSGTLLQPESV